MDSPLKIVVVGIGPWHLVKSAQTYEKDGCLAGLYYSGHSVDGIHPDRIHRCIPHFFCHRIAAKLTPGRLFDFWRWFFYPLYTLWLKRKLKAVEFDVVHALGWSAKAAFDIAESRGGLKVYDSCNGFPDENLERERREIDKWNPGVRQDFPDWVIRQSSKDALRADVVLCPSHWVYDSMTSHGVDPEKCALNPFGVDLELFQERDDLPAFPRFICVGALRLRKGLQYLLPAFDRMLERFPEAELILVGGFHNDFKPVWEKWSQHPNIRHFHNMPHSELCGLLRTCTAFVLPSVEEGFARAIIEAMASALPIVATYESGATTLVEHEKSGVIVPSCDAGAIQKAMEKLAADPDLCKQMGHEAALRGRAGNSWDDYGRRCLKIIREFQAK